MKRLFIIVAMAGLGLVACTKNEVVPSASEQQEIIFADPVSHVVTKVNLITGNYPAAEANKFSVFADYHKAVYATAKAAASNFTAYMRGDTPGYEGVDVTYKTNAVTMNGKTFNQYWAPAKTYYWPKEGYLTFAAYSPAEAKAHAEISYSVENGVSISSYVVKTDLTNQYDFMLSNRVTDQQSTTMTVDGPYDGVQLEFSHVLSAIDFTVKTDDNYKTDSYTITLQSITIQNAFTAGTLTQFAGFTPDAVNLAAIWSGQTTEGSYQVPNTSAVEITSTQKAITPETDIADLVLLPQRLAHTATGESNKKVQAVVAYTVSHPDMGGASIPYTATLDLSGATGGKWEAGKRYTYNISIGMEKVVFAPKVNTWTNGGGGDF